MTTCLKIRDTGKQASSALAKEQPDSGGTGEPDLIMASERDYLIDSSFPGMDFFFPGEGAGKGHHGSSPSMTVRIM
jgi:hypothetical protein